MDVMKEIIYPAMKDFAETVEGLDQVKFTPETKLVGSGAVFDSVALVSFLVAVEARTEETTGASITIADERALSRKQSPFLTLGTLATYVDELVKEAGK